MIRKVRYHDLINLRRNSRISRKRHQREEWEMKAKEGGKRSGNSKAKKRRFTQMYSQLSISVAAGITVSSLQTGSSLCEIIFGRNHWVRKFFIHSVPTTAILLMILEIIQSAGSINHHVSISSSVICGRPIRIETQTFRF